MGLEAETKITGPNPLTEIQQIRYQFETDMRTSILHLKQSEFVIERQRIEIHKCEEHLKEIKNKMSETNDTEEKQSPITE